MPPRVHGDHKVRIIRGHHYASELPADIAKITGVTTHISVYLHRIRDDRQDLSLGPTVPAKPVLRVMSEAHAASRARRLKLSPFRRG